MAPLDKRSNTKFLSQHSGALSCPLANNQALIAPAYETRPYRKSGIFDIKERHDGKDSRAIGRAVR
ncbi:MAG: hypothetical protein KKD09_08015 [Gammaproteobacteria bacterium]|nr:hypothetical protein [Gammaproteobacteria bacterium]